MNGRAIGQQQRRAFFKAAFRGKHKGRSCGNRCLFNHATRTSRGEHAISHLPAGHTFAHRLHNTRNLAARRKGSLRLELVFVLDDEHIGIIDRAGLDRDKQLARASDRIGDFFQDQGFRTTDNLR